MSDRERGMCEGGSKNSAGNRALDQEGRGKGMLLASVCGEALAGGGSCVEREGRCKLRKAGAGGTGRMMGALPKSWRRQGIRRRGEEDDEEVEEVEDGRRTAGNAGSVLSGPRSSSGVAILRALYIWRCGISCKVRYSMETASD